MIPQLRDKKVIFFDVGYTLDMPASGDWMFTGRFLQEAGDRLKTCGDQRIRIGTGAQKRGKNMDLLRACT